MATFNVNSATTTKSSKIMYDYTVTTISKSEISFPTDSTGKNTYMSVPFVNPNTSIYYTYSGGNTNYISQHAYLYGAPLHNITGITDSTVSPIIGELVIKNTSTNGQILYMCFLLQKPPSTNPPPGSDIDDMIYLYQDNSTLNANIILNGSIPSQKSPSIMYTSSSTDSTKTPCTVCIFTTPIVVNQASNDTILNKCTSIITTFFATSAPTSYAGIPSANISMKVEEQIYIDCNPTGESDENISTYNVPINSEFTHGKQQVESMKTMVSFVLFIVFSVLAYIFTPMAYKFFVIEKVIYGAMSDKKTRIASVDVFVSILFIIFSITLIVQGIKTDSWDSMVTPGFVLLLYYFFAVCVIQYSKTSRDFMIASKKPDYLNAIYPDRWRIFFDPNDFGGLIVDIIIFVFWTCAIYTFGAMICATILFVLLGLLRQISWSSAIFWTLIMDFVIIPIVIPLIMLMADTD